MADELVYFDLIREGNLAGLTAAFAAEPNARQAVPYGQSLVLHAVLEGQLPALRFLLAQGCDPNVGEPGGMSPLHAAAQLQNVGALELLIAAGAQVDSRDGYGNTPLIEAVFTYRDDPAAVQVLLQHGAEPQLKNASGISASDLAQTTNKRALLALFSRQ